MPQKVRAKHILVKTEQEANVILYDLKNGKDFDEVAKEKSLCPSGKKGGDLGWFGRNQMVKEFEITLLDEYLENSRVFRHNPGMME